MKYLMRILCLVFLIGIISVCAQAGVLILSESESYDYPQKTVSKTYIENDRVRIDAKGGIIDGSFIYRADKQQLWNINHKDRTIMVMTKQDMEAVKNRMDQAMRQMKEQLENLPEEQRQQIEQMMQQQGGKNPYAMTAEEKPQFRKTVSKIKVNKWICDKYEGYKHGEKEEEVWTADWKSLGLKQQDFNALEQMGKMYESMSGVDASFFKVGTDDWEQTRGYPGIPIRSITYINNQPQTKTDIIEIKRQKFKSDIFEPPAGYRRITPDQMTQR